MTEEIIMTEQEKRRLERLKALGNYRGKDRVITSEEAIEIKNRRPKTPTFDCKLPRLNIMTDGFKKGELIVVSGSTGQGKTTFLQSLTYDFGEVGLKPMWFSYEVGIDDLLDRFPKVPLFSLPLETVPNSVKWLETRIMEGIAKHGVNVVFIDHLHFLISMGSMQGNTSLMIGQVMRDLKTIAIRNKIIIFLVSHMKHTEITDKPTVNDLRDSSFIGQEADMVFFVWRDKDDKGDFNKQTFLRVVKNRRKGNIGAIKLTYRDGRFYEVVND